ncbi:unnamed protein product [Anisakis simplex]|uniref:Tyramine beta-hydroxylase (inferred by orthology to a C. elegans protein) n=1 Tax=Anisakis simplex TaxID=6269 RepID=A0A0M3K055_ANISI|nr:unnamed protein product [Anisakis simplex]
MSWAYQFIIYTIVGLELMNAKNAQFALKRMLAQTLNAFHKRENCTRVDVLLELNLKTEKLYYNVRISGLPIAWFLIGFSDHGEFHGADFCKFDGSNLLDGYIGNDLNMEIDMQQDCILYDTDMEESVRFSKRLRTCDMRDYAIETGTTQFLIAIGNGEQEYLSDGGVSKEITFANLYEYELDFSDEDTNTYQTSITANDSYLLLRTTERIQCYIRFEQMIIIAFQDALIPAEVTTYWCAVKKLDPVFLTKKHHITKICNDFEWFYNGDCNSADKPKEMRSCSKVIAAWSFGAGALNYPPEAGMPIGGDDYYPYLMVEIHYNNVDKLSGVVDNSGFTLSYTDELRTYDAGILELGLIYSDANSIPPYQYTFPISGYCTRDCTEHLPSEGINIFATQLHAHLTGRKLWTSHYRNGIKIGEINRENHYSPHWQHINMLKEPINVLPGGYGIEDEMCVNYVYYYPASEVEVCKSAIDNSTLREFFKKLLFIPEHPLQIINAAGKGVSDGMSINNMFNAVEWSSQTYSSLKELYNVGDLNVHCLQHDGNPFPVSLHRCSSNFSATPSSHILRHQMPLNTDSLVAFFNYP